MLISHQYKFIIKTVKTAGTSVEAFLEPFCCPPGHTFSTGLLQLLVIMVLLVNAGHRVTATILATITICLPLKSGSDARNLMNIHVSL